MVVGLDVAIGKVGGMYGVMNGTFGGGNPELYITAPMNCDIMLIMFVADFWNCPSLSNSRFSLLSSLASCCLSISSHLFLPSLCVFNNSFTMPPAIFSAHCTLVGLFLFFFGIGSSSSPATVLEEGPEDSMVLVLEEQGAVCYWC